MPRSALKPLLESTGILKLGFNIKFTAVALAQHGVTLRNQDDVQLMSYALDAEIGAETAAGVPRHPQARLQHQVHRRGAGAARRYAAQPGRRTADVLRARCRA